MKLVSVLMTVMFAGVVAHANETAPAAPAHEAAATETKTVEKKETKVKKTHAKKEKAPEAAPAPAGH